MTGFLDSAKHLFITETRASEVRLYFYAATCAGWRQLSHEAMNWTSNVAGRRLTAYVGTDHALTEAAALEAMRDDGVAVHLLRRYKGIFHPKLLWFYDCGRGHVLVGSNNLTLDGLKSNIEFASLTQLSAADPHLDRWHQAVHSASDLLTDDLLDSYRTEKESFGKARAKAKVAATFTWSKRSSGDAPVPPPASRRAQRASVPVSGVAAGAPRPQVATAAAGVQSGDLIIEIMPLETGTGGSQIQLPLAAASTFFGLPQADGAQVAVTLRNVETSDSRSLTMTRFGNSTARLVIRELDYRDRPCVVLFRRAGRRRIDFTIVREAIDPNRYRAALRACGPPTRAGSKRWKLVP